MGELSHLPLSNSEREPCQGHNQGSGYTRIWELETVSGSAQTPTLNQSQVHVNTAFEEINQILSLFLLWYIDYQTKVDWWQKNYYVHNCPLQWVGCGWHLHNILSGKLLTYWQTCQIFAHSHSYSVRKTPGFSSYCFIILWVGHCILVFCISNQNVFLMDSDF